MSTYRKKVIGLIAFAAVCLATLGYLFVLAGGRFRVNEPYHGYAMVPDSLNIVPNSDVRLADGVKVGRVRELEPYNGVSRVKFEIEKKDGKPIYRDATVRVRTKTLVGESYLQINPGSPQAGPEKDGFTLPLDSANDAVPLERILNSLDEPTRKEIRRNLKGIGVGLDGHEKDLNEFFGALKPTFVDGETLMGVLRPQRKQLAALIENTGLVLDAFGQRSADLRSLAVDAKASAEAAAARDEKLAASLDELPPTLTKAKDSVQRLASFSTKATPVFRNLKNASKDLAPAVRDLGPASRDTRKLFNRIQPFLRNINPVFQQLAPASRQLAKMIGPLNAVLREADPFVAYLNPYIKDIQSFFGNVPAVFTKDAVGYKGRVYAQIGPNQLTNLSTTQRALLDALINAGAAGIMQGTKINPYPKPGAIGNPADFTGQVPKVEALPPSGRR